MDADVYSADDTIGWCIIDASSMTLPDSDREIAGWFPLYDTLDGLRGELHLSLKLDTVFINMNPYSDASSEVRLFFSYPSPACFVVLETKNFAEELIVHDDMEYALVDHFRSSRKSNEERQKLLYKMSGELRRRVGRKVMDKGKNHLFLRLSVCPQLTESDG